MKKNALQNVGNTVELKNRGEACCYQTWGYLW